MLLALRRCYNTAAVETAVTDGVGSAIGDAIGTLRRIPEFHKPQLWTSYMTRCGALAIKLGMLSLYDGWGQRHPVTVLHLADCTALSAHPTEKGRVIQELAIGRKVPHKLSKPQLGYYAKLEVCPKRQIQGFVISERAAIPASTPIRAAHYIPGQLINVQARTVGKGFQGGMKRWGFAGMPASHGVSASHRKIGAIGGREDPSGVMKGKKMPGRMGARNATQLCLKVLHGRADVW